VSPTEAWLTLVFFFVLIASAYGMDKFKAIQVKKEQALVGGNDDRSMEMDMVFPHSAKEIYKELIDEKLGVKAKDEDHAEKRAEMKHFIRRSFTTDQIDKVNFDDHKKEIEGETMLSRNI